MTSHKNITPLQLLVLYRVSFVPVWSTCHKRLDDLSCTALLQIMESTTFFLIDLWPLVLLTFSNLFLVDRSQHNSNLLLHLQRSLLFWIFQSSYFHLWGEFVWWENTHSFVVFFFFCQNSLLLYLTAILINSFTWIG